MRVLYIMDVGEYYGATESFFQMADKLLKIDGFEMIIATSGSGRVKKWAELHDVKSVQLGHKAFFISPGSTKIKRILKHLLNPLIFLDYKIANNRALRIANKELDFRKIDVIHSNVNRNDIGAILAKQHNIPHVWHIREFGEAGLECRSLRHNYIEYMNNHASIFIMISNAVADYWKYKGLNSTLFKIIPDGVELSEELTAKRQILVGPIKRIVFVGGFLKLKGQDQLIEAVKLMPDSLRKSITVDFYGDGEDFYKAMVEKVHEYKLDKTIHFKGYIDNAASILPNYDIGIVSSINEGLGRVTIEYMQAGLLVIGANTGATNEIVDNSRGMLYEHGNTKQLCDCIIRAIEDPDMSNELAQKGQKFALKEYDTTSYAEKIVNTYSQFIN